MIKHIVVADDERSSAMLMSRSLEKEGFRVTTAYNGREAFNIVNSQQVDLLITDVVMPEMDGVDLYMRLKENPVTAHIPIIIVTDKEVFQESFSALGVELYSPKPFNLKDLMEKIKKVDAKATETRQYHKVVVIGPNRDVLDKMRIELQSRGCIVATVDNVIEIGLRCFLVNPRLIFVDLHSRDYATTKEIIASIRSYDFFKYTKIVLYANFSSDDVAGMPSLENMEVEIKACMEAGADKYIGRFNRVTFLEQLKDFGI
ncbi:MAG: response regulator [Candidatus Omnitrophica bacterium]|nr:response regulator [Candidatus Omnitrophota bacterium]